MRDNAQAYNRCMLSRANRYGRKVFVWPMAAITEWEGLHLEWNMLSDMFGIVIKDVNQVVNFTQVSFFC